MDVPSAVSHIQGHGLAHRDAPRQDKLAGGTSAAERRHLLTVDVSDTDDVAVQLGELGEH